MLIEIDAPPLLFFELCMPTATSVSYVIGDGQPWEVRDVDEPGYPKTSIIVLLGLNCASDLLSGQPESPQQGQWGQCNSEDPAQAIVARPELIGSDKMADATLAEAFKDRGRAYAHRRDYDRAIHDYTQAARLNPSDPNVFDGRFAYWHKSDYDRTIENYDQALRLRPVDADALIGRGRGVLG